MAVEGQYKEADQPLDLLRRQPEARQTMDAWRRFAASLVQVISFGTGGFIGMRGPEWMRP